MGRLSIVGILWLLHSLPKPIALVLDCGLRFPDESRVSGSELLGVDGHMSFVMLTECCGEIVPRLLNRLALLVALSPPWKRHRLLYIDRFSLNRVTVCLDRKIKIYRAAFLG